MDKQTMSWNAFRCLKRQTPMLIEFFFFYRYSKLKGDQYFSDSAPFSCCNPAALRPCIHYDITSIDKDSYDPDVASTLHSTGCVDALMTYYENYLLQPLGLAVFVIFGLEVIFCICWSFCRVEIARLNRSQCKTFKYLIQIWIMVKENKGQPK